jgi:hypothetical protein
MSVNTVVQLMPFFFPLKETNQAFSNPPNDGSKPRIFFSWQYSSQIIA